MATVPERISISGISMEIMRAGKGPPLLYLHGGDGIDWNDDALARLSQSFEVIAAAHPGFGNSDLPRWMSSVDDLSYVYLDLMDELGLRDAMVWGASFGAWLAMEIAVKSTARIGRLVLSGAVGVKFGSRETRDIVDLFSLTPKEQAETLYSDAARFAPKYSSWPPEALAVVARNREAFALFGWSPTLHDPKLRQRLHRIRVPSLVLWGEADRVVSTEYGRMLAAALPAAQFHAFAGCGHYPHVEQPEAFADAVARFAGRAK